MPARQNQRGKGKGKGKSNHNNDYGPARTPQEVGELFAVVSRIYGGENMGVTCSDGKERLCVIRRKFRGRHKRSNEVTIGSLVLVGLYDWATKTHGKKQKCDLLHVYSREQSRSFAKQGLLGSNIQRLIAAVGDARAIAVVDDSLEFAHDGLEQTDDYFEDSASTEEDGENEDDADAASVPTVVPSAVSVVTGEAVNIDDI